MGGGDLPKGFPVPQPTTSYWQIPPHPLANHRTTPCLPTSSTLDYIIIGSGLSGAAVAHKLLSHDPKRSILMLEARTAASAASGRNGGNCRAGWWLNFKKYAEKLGEVEALKFDALEAQNVVDMAEFVRQYHVECDFEDVETADTYTVQQEWDDLLEVLRFREEVQRRWNLQEREVKRVWEGEAARKHLGLPDLVGAVTYHAHTLNPYLLVSRMLELSLDKGLNLQTNTPALAVMPVSESSDSNAKWEVQTDRGVVRAKSVVLATNGYTNALYPGIADTKFLTPGRSQISAVRSKKDLSDHPVQRKSVGVNDRGTGDYFFMRAPGLKGAGDVIYGGGRFISKTKDLGITDDSKVNEAIAQYVKWSVPDVFGREAWGKGSKEVRDWSGITCYTPDSFPLVGEVPGQKGLWASVGMNGHGMAMALRSAEALVGMMTTGKEPSWFPKCFRVGRAWTGEKTTVRPLDSVA
ncbi:FAD dependent oxidoreductase superfamily protein [Aulographum hederae CBS 113979]|uniref:FAD dependent oxidoreductase superfamily protein n=1 Tax=Aulographum hederae CBS 113979 TaxID=1176131 RepID=A0A6G1HDR2_9PEZI|nr:FAD dependent oxidoreductase superfamily protein [Aulographum hederae CBS 113979]